MISSEIRSWLVQPVPATFDTLYNHDLVFMLNRDRFEMAYCPLVASTRGYDHREKTCTNRSIKTFIELARKLVGACSALHP